MVRVHVSSRCSTESLHRVIPLSKFYLHLNFHVQHFLLRSECEHLIRQGILEHIVSWRVTNFDIPPSPTVIDMKCWLGKRSNCVRLWCLDDYQQHRSCFTRTSCGICRSGSPPDSDEWLRICDSCFDRLTILLADNNYYNYIYYIVGTHT